MSRIVFGLFAPAIITLVVWFIGYPPAVSLFWDSASATVVGHETFDANTGYGIFRFNEPLVLIENQAKPIRMNLAGVAELEQIKADWPVGKKVRVKINPGLTKAFAHDDPRLSYIAPIAIFLLALVIIGFTVASYFVVLNTMSLAAAGFGLVFIFMPLLITLFRWQIGHPPPSAHFFWPSATVEIASQEIMSQPVGNGTTRYIPVIMVRMANTAELVSVDGYLGSFRKEAEDVLAQRGVGKMIKVNISPEGVPFEARWDLQQIVTVILTCLLPGFLLIGVVLLSLAWPQRQR